MQPVKSCTVLKFNFTRCKGSLQFYWYSCSLLSLWIIKKHTILSLNLFNSSWCKKCNDLSVNINDSSFIFIKLMNQMFGSIFRFQFRKHIFNSTLPEIIWRTDLSRCLWLVYSVLQTLYILPIYFVSFLFLQLQQHKYLISFSVVGERSQSNALCSYFTLASYSLSKKL